MDASAEGILIQRSPSWILGVRPPVCSARENLRDFAVRCGYLGAVRVYNPTSSAFNHKIWARKASESPANDPARQSRFMQRLKELVHQFDAFLAELHRSGFQMSLLPGYSTSDVNCRKNEFEPEYRMRQTWIQQLSDTFGLISSACELMPETLDPGSYMIIDMLLRRQITPGIASDKLHEHHSFMQDSMAEERHRAVRSPVLERIHQAALGAIETGRPITMSDGVPPQVHRQVFNRQGRLALAGVSLEQFLASSEHLDNLVRSQPQLPADDMERANRLYHAEIGLLCAFVGVPCKHTTRPEMQDVVDEKDSRERMSKTVEQMRAARNDMAIIMWRQQRAQFFHEFSQGIGINQKIALGGVSVYEVKLDFTDEDIRQHKRKFETLCS